MTPVFCADALTKRYGSFLALSRMSLSLFPGEVVGLLGPNGAGKSTLIGLISGAARPDSGGMQIGREVYSPRAPADARRLGVIAVGQELAYFSHLSVTDNIRILFNDAVAKELESQFSEVKRAGIGSFSPGEIQSFFLKSALLAPCRLLLLDEPTALLSRGQSAAFLRDVRRRADSGQTVLLSSHRSDDITMMDRWIFLVNGQVYSEGRGSERALSLLNHAGSGRQLETVTSPDHCASTSPRIYEFGSLDFTPKSGKVLSINVASPHLVDLIGRRVRTSLNHQNRTFSFVGSDRKRDHLIPHFTCESHADIWLGGRWRQQYGLEIEETLADFGIECNLDFWKTPVAILSGGTQQKLFLTFALCSRWAVRVLSEPMRGLDSASTRTLITRLQMLASAGDAIVVISQDEAVLAGTADFLLVIDSVNAARIS